MHVYIYDIFQVECLSVDKFFVFRLCLHFSHHNNTFNEKPVCWLG